MFVVAEPVTSFSDQPQPKPAVPFHDFGPVIDEVARKKLEGFMGIYGFVSRLSCATLQKKDCLGPAPGLRVTRQYCVNVDFEAVLAVEPQCRSVLAQLRKEPEVVGQKAEMPGL